MVPGSTLMYGSSFTRVTLRPRASRMAPSEAAAMPFPSEETTPPVTQMNLVMGATVAGEARREDSLSERPLSGHRKSPSAQPSGRPSAGDRLGLGDCGTPAPLDAPRRLARRRRQSAAARQVGNGDDLAVHVHARERAAHPRQHAALL